VSLDVRYTTSLGYLQVIFTSDNDINAAGFEVTWSVSQGATSETTCMDCAVGKYSAATGQTSSATCSDCAAGKYSAAGSSTDCTNCVAGKFSAAVGANVASTCADCGAGKYSELPGASKVRHVDMLLFSNFCSFWDHLSFSIRLGKLTSPMR
jgi:hypothetical protein